MITLHAAVHLAFVMESEVNGIEIPGSAAGFRVVGIPKHPAYTKSLIFEGVVDGPKEVLERLEPEVLLLEVDVVGPEG